MPLVAFTNREFAALVAVHTTPPPDKIDWEGYDAARARILNAARKPAPRYNPDPPAAHA
jgi:hypothetical protein